MNHLNQLQIGCRAFVHSLTATGSMRRRLLDLGFVRGAEIRCLFAGPSGEPRAFLVKNTVVALRKEDAASVLIRQEARA